MAKHFKMNFSLSNSLSPQVLELGSVGETVWSLVLSHDSRSGAGRVSIIRSRSNGEVQIDVKVWNQGLNLLFESGHLLSDGQESKQFFCIPIYLHKSFEGYVLVRYDSNCMITSKKEAVTQTENSISSPQLAKDLVHLMDNPDSFSDTTLVCGTSKVLVHRNILSARSPVFAAMFKSQMQEGRDGVVHIVDMEPHVLQAMLKYVYSGNTDHLTCSLAGDLLFAADKYELEELKSICVHQLNVSMAADNVFCILVLGDLHDKNLKAHAVKFICEYKNFSDLEKTEEWQSLQKDRPSLALEVTITIVKYLQNK